MTNPNCHYCGIPSTTEDYIVPSFLLQRAGAQGLSLQGLNRIKRWQLPACAECAKALQGRIHRSMSERKLEVNKWLSRKYKKFLEVPDWTPDETSELGRNMRTEVNYAVHERDKLRKRLEHVPLDFDIGPVFRLFQKLK